MVILSINRNFAVFPSIVKLYTMWYFLNADLYKDDKAKKYSMVPKLEMWKAYVSKVSHMLYCLFW